MSEKKSDKKNGKSESKGKNIKSASKVEKKASASEKLEAKAKKSTKATTNDNKNVKIIVKTKEPKKKKKPEVELAETVVLKDAEASAVKEFVSKSTDSYKPTYEAQSDDSSENDDIQAGGFGLTVEEARERYPESMNSITSISTKAVRLAEELVNQFNLQEADHPPKFIPKIEFIDASRANKKSYSDSRSDDEIPSVFGPFNPNTRDNEPLKVFVSGVCCEHDWTDTGYTHGMKTQICAKCKAKCSREKGKIVLYTANLPPSAFGFGSVPN